MLSRALELKRDQILVLIAKDFKLKYNSTALGFLWSLLVPIFSSIIYYFVFGVLLRFHIPNYLLYLLSGNFLWQFFAHVVMMNGKVILNNSQLLKKTSFGQAQRPPQMRTSSRPSSSASSKASCAGDYLPRRSRK